MSKLTVLPGLARPEPDGDVAVSSVAPLLQSGAMLSAHLLEGSYQIVRRLPREGALGQVFAALHGPTRIQYALKLLRPERLADPERLTRLRREAPVLATLRHPNLVSVVDWEAQAPGPAYLVSEFVDAERLSDVLLRRERPFSPEEALELCRQVGAALQCLHGAGLCHGGLHPGNIFVTTGAQGERCYRIADFGLWWLLLDKGPRGRRQPTGLSAETAGYLAPEQARGDLRLVDPRSDQFALAALCYELLAGRPAFRQPGDDVQAVLRRVMDEDPVPVLLPAALERALPRALQRGRESRFGDMNEFLFAITPQESETRTALLLPPAVLPRSGGRPPTGLVGRPPTGAPELRPPSGAADLRPGEGARRPATSVSADAVPALPKVIVRQATAVVQLLPSEPERRRRALLVLGLVPVVLLGLWLALRRPAPKPQPIAQPAPHKVNPPPAVTPPSVVAPPSAATPPSVATPPSAIAPPVPSPVAPVSPAPPAAVVKPKVVAPAPPPKPLPKTPPKPPKIDDQRARHVPLRPSPVDGAKQHGAPRPLKDPAPPRVVFSPGKLNLLERQAITGCLLRSPRRPALALRLHGGVVAPVQRPAGGDLEPLWRCLSSLRFPGQPPQPRLEQVSVQ